MTITDLKNKLAYKFRQMTYNRSLTDWEKGYTKALNETLAAINAPGDGDDASEALWEKRRWAATHAAFAQLLPHITSPEDIEGVVQTAIYAAGRLTDEYRQKESLNS